MRLNILKHASQQNILSSAVFIAHQWRAVTSEAGHAIRMQMLVIELTCNTLRMG